MICTNSNKDRIDKPSKFWCISIIYDFSKPPDSLSEYAPEVKGVKTS
ncbi:Uncharacterized protein dnl_41200 [Desulfonema limicola]|uniref:Uncharacterized protein n=1 Tax=Desulfonema limicola TaxID=45656 RepID=A0A975BAH7_9BACT|nr:Uncharacterized protein dnl_41200 [Desulfonema limicola]